MCVCVLTSNCEFSPITLVHWFNFPLGSWSLKRTTFQDPLVTAATLDIRQICVCRAIGPRKTEFASIASVSSITFLLAAVALCSVKRTLC